MARFFIDDLSPGYQDVLRRAFEYFGASLSLKPSDKVVIKPNLTYPVYRPGVMTSPELVHELLCILRQFTKNITVCESDSGGYNPFSMSQVFRDTGLVEIADRLGVKLVNLSNEPGRVISVKAGLRMLQVPLPRLVVDDADCFFTIPVVKVHLNTLISVATKNQWGIIQQPSLRLKLHPYFKHVIYAINKALPKSFVVVDGRYGLNRSGPMCGEPVLLNWLAVSDSIFHADLVVSNLMGIPWQDVPYLAHIFSKEGISLLSEIAFNTDLERFRKVRFYLERKWTDYPGLACFNSRSLAYVGYESPLASALHWLLYRVREPFY